MDELEAQVEAAKYAANFLSRNSKILIKVWDGVKVKAKAKANLEATYSEYLESSCKHLARTKPSIFGAEPIPLYDFYVPLDVKLGKREVLESVDYQSLAGILPQGRAVISGTAGGGKSVLMRHLFISALKNGHHIPVFLELRKVNQDRLPLKVMIGKALQLFNFNSGGSIDEYVDLALEKGHFALILDGYDEVDLDHKQKLTKELLELSAGAPDCFVVISTRPDESIQGWDGFSNLSLQPLSKGQALQLVDNLPYDNAVKSKFSIELDETLYDEHREFLSNPLLLVIMIVTYGRSGEIPLTLNEFYGQAFDALFHHHDASKEVYKRKRHCVLGLQDFSKLFSAFCIRTYTQNKYEFTRLEALDHVEKSKSVVGVDVRNEDFLKDMQSSVCLLVQDGLSLVFAHRSFQEYFSAKFIVGAGAEQQEVLLGNVIANWDSDKVIPLLVEMAPEVVERALFLPKLNWIFENIGVSKNVGITHYYKYISSCFTRFKVEGRVRDLGKKKEMRTGEMYSVAGLLNKFLNNAPSDINKLFDLFSDYQDTLGKNTLYLKDLNYKSTLINILAEESDSFSLANLKELWAWKKKLEKKYRDPTKILDSLLAP